eukprot:TRINITY_DN5294_c0_g1_i2.p1 TRINITY_DN5294_c0_g1~~TRINITY_DN5294_c0_g1_i2.p1  ORF type:complete len:383 (+),score=44.18 TRINITY_DN5294_c0_g1_i2:2-1150(+)
MNAASPPQAPPMMASPLHSRNTNRKWSVVLPVSKNVWKPDAETRSVAVVEKTVGCGKKLSWIHAVDYHKSEEGSEGVFFIGWSDNLCCVLKGSSCVIASAFAHSLAVIAGLPVPQYRLVYYKKGDEFRHIKTMYRRLDLTKMETDRNKWNKSMLIPIIFEMEYIPGVSSDEVPPGYLSANNEWGVAALSQLGKLLIFDVFINNWDRFPFIWRKEGGNHGNFLFLPGNMSTPVIGLDQCVTGISPLGVSHSQFEIYRQKVQALMQELLSISPQDPQWSKKYPLVASCVHFLDSNTIGTTFTSREFDLIARGMMDCVIDIATKITPNHIQSLYNSFQAEVSELVQVMTWGIDEVGLYGLSLVNVPFLESMHSIFTDFAIQFQKK